MGLVGSLSTVEQVSRRRPLFLLAVSAAEVAASVAASRSMSAHASLTRAAAGQVPGGLSSIGMWVLWSLCLAGWLFMTPGVLKLGAADRRRLDDELVLHHRARATRLAFAVLACAVLAAACLAAAGSLPVWWPVASLSASLCVGALSFAVAELRADA